MAFCPAPIGRGVQAWDDRQPNWLGVKQLTDCLSRIQHVLQKGTAKVDLAIYRHSYQEVLDCFHPEKLLQTSTLEQLGYSYDFISPSHLSDFDVSYDGEGIFSNGPGYRALIFNEQTHLPLPVWKKLMALSKQELPIIFCGGIPRNGAFFGETPNVAEIEELLKSEHVFVCEEIEQIPELLSSLHILPRVAYREPTKVLNAYRKAEEADYVYF